MIIRIDGIEGERLTGYVDGLKGPTQCGNCHAFDPEESSCKNPDMRKQSKLKKLKNGNVEVTAEGSCIYIHRIGTRHNKKYGR
jgi:hypothetical protein